MNWFGWVMFIIGMGVGWNIHGIVVYKRLKKLITEED